MARGWPRAFLPLLPLLAAGCFGGFSWPEPQPHACDDAAGSGLACTTVWEGLGSPAQVVWHEGVLFVAAQEGRVWRMVEGVADHAPVLDLRDRVATCHYEQGLLGLAFDGSHMYVAFTEDQPCSRKGRWDKGDVLLVRYPEPGRNPLAASEGQELLRVPQPYRNHNGGHIAFGPDGMLYLGLGDGGDHGDPLQTGPDPSDMLASILRLDVSGDRAVGAPDNPFAADPEKDPRVLHYGLRNPWRFAFDADGGLWIADVGQDCFEEVSYAPPGAAGLDFGWSRREGPAPYPNQGCHNAEGMRDAAWTEPLWSYGRDQGCSIVGGPVLPEAAWVPADLVGTFMAADFCTGRLWSIAGNGTARALLDTGLQVTSMTLGPDGLYVGHWKGSIHRIAQAELSQSGTPATQGNP